MRLKRLELFGFKSFADRTVLSFQHDLIGIVGPNGCGKSNVVDAVRWVLGEQRASSMRGGEMTDVIFKGSASRPVMSVAEGTIVFDNSAGTLEGHGDEVSVTRRVYRSGEGEYLIDGSRVRLKDVREMLYGTGLGSRGYSVLEQGKIDAILSANAVERRAIFEEAAGVSRYRQRKKEAESRLKRVEADVLRLDDVVGELERRERSLKIQAGKARRFVEARDAWRVDGHRLACHQLHGLAGSIAEQGRVLTELEREVASQRGKRGAAEEDVVARELEQQALAAELERVAAESSDLAGEVRALDERRAQIAARVEAWHASSADEAKRAKALSERHEERRGEGEAFDGELSRLESECAEAQERARVLNHETTELSANLTRVSAAVEEKNALVLRHFHDLTSTKSRIEHLADALEPLAERAMRAEERRSGGNDEVRAAREDEGRAMESLRAATETLAKGEENYAACEQETAAIDTELAELDRRRLDLELRSARLQSRVESLRDWERERDGLGAGARELFGAIERGEGPIRSDELLGLFADHVRADTRIARAFDAALGARAQALVLASPNDATAVLEWLKAREGGRVALVLPEGLAQRSASVPDALLAQDGVEGTLLAQCRADDGFESVARALVGDVVVVRDARVGMALLTEHPTLRFVTPEGDLFDAAGVEGGHVEVAQGAVGRRSTADELEQERVESGRELEAALADLGARRTRRDGLHVRLRELREAVREAARERSGAAGALDAVRARLEELVRAMDLAERECEGLAHERDGIDEELVEARTRCAELESTYDAERRQLDDLEEQRKALEAERGQRTRDEGQARVEATELQERVGALRRRRQDLERACEELVTEIERASRLTREHAANAESGDAEGVELGQTRDELLARRGELEERLMALRDADAKGRETIEALRRRGESITGELETLLDRVSESRLEKQKLELQRDELARRAEEDFGQPSHRMLEGFEPEEELAPLQALAELEARVLELKRSMDKLGPVNLEAVEELEEVSERLGFLTTQRDDLNEARKNLEGTIRKLNEESERRFIEAFDAIRENFKLLFRQLFGGGRADVMLEEGVSVLDAGIEIIARPPGRETLPISLLSGGQRTLTALALLFAVFRTNSSPFCILDEVDAALDDANIGRFLSMIEHNLSETQYVIVTHNKGTMAACQVLYGVTMAIKGVSNVVSVELDEVDEFVPEATGGARPALVPPVTDPVDDDEPELELAQPSAEAPEASADGSDEGLEDVVLVPVRPAGEADGDPEPAPEVASGVESEATSATSN